MPNMPLLIVLSPPIAQADWQTWLVHALAACFLLGLLVSLRTWRQARRTIRTQIDADKPDLAEVRRLADAKGRPLPFVVILVPAREESAVIANTLARLAELDYPNDRYAAVVITDARERGDGASPTTRQVAETVGRSWRQGQSHPFLHVLDVPHAYSGRFGDTRPTGARSTKGRALNFALEYIRQDARLAGADMLGLLDADGRLHREVLREVAWKVLADGCRLMQGPVFQVSNLQDVGLIGKAAGVELSVYHLSSLARQLTSGRATARFLAGTNYFIDPKLMIAVGGWDDTALVEDAELGLRLFLREGVTPAWLSCYELEQTPPDCRSYLRQRQRWALGHFQLLPMIRRSALPWTDKLWLHLRVLHAMWMCPFDVGLPVLAWMALLLGWTAGVSPAANALMVGLLIGSLFVWDYFGRGARMLNGYRPSPAGRLARWTLAGQFFLVMPALIVLQAIPRLAAFAQYLTGRGTRDWVKTPRTAERPVGQAHAAAEVVAAVE